MIWLTAQFLFDMEKIELPLLSCFRLPVDVIGVFLRVEYRVLVNREIEVIVLVSISSISF